MIIFRPALTKISHNAIVLITQSQVQRKVLNISDQDLRQEVCRLIRTKKFLGSQGELFPFIYKNQLVLLAGLGSAMNITSSGLRRCVRNTFLSGFAKTMKTAVVFPHSNNDDAIEGIIEGICIGTYCFNKHMTVKNESRLKNIILVCPDCKKYRESLVISQGVNFARDLVNDNAETIHSEYIEKVLKRVIQGQKNIAMKVLGPKELKTKGLNLFLAVNKGSRFPAKLAIVDFRGGRKKEKYTAICGKGITFDAGGLNMKPTGYIEAMRFDMAGAAAVIGVLQNAVHLKVKKNILFVIGLAENAVGSCAQKPGDVIKSYSGKTIEIANTDAEGRLVLADVMSYVVKNYQPACIIDIATLTGACAVALGYEYSGVLSNNDDLVKKILTSGQETNDKVWQLPLDEEIQEHLKSQYADLKNIGLPKGVAGTISAAEFLRQFVDNTPWAHIDIAATAFINAPTRMYFGYGATGSGVRLLTHFLQN